MQKRLYPSIPRGVASYILHNKTIPEPFQALEDPDSDACKSFVTAQNELFASVMKDMESTLIPLEKSISAMQNFSRTSTVSQYNQRFYYYHNSGLQNQSVLMRSASRAAAQKGEGETFLDPNSFSSDGTTALTATAWSDSETLFAYAISEKGSDWKKIRVREAEAMQDLPDVVDWVKYSGITWLGDIGFFYTRFPAITSQDKGAETDTAENASVYFHKLGTSQEEDVQVLAPDPDHKQWLYGAEVSDCKRYLLIGVRDGCEQKSLLWVADLPADGAAPTGPLSFRKIINEWVGEYNYLGNDGDVFYFSTTTDAPKTKIISMNIRTLATETMIPESTFPLTSSCLVGDTLFVGYMEDVKDVAYFSRLSSPSALTRIPLPIGSIDSFGARRKASFVGVKLSSFLFAGRSFTLTPEDPVSSLEVFRDDVVEGLNPDEFVSKQVFYPSNDRNDGTAVPIPMFIVHHKDVALDGTAPLLVYGYGGFNISLTPGFSPSRVVYMKHLRGIFAMPNIRGGGEYGIAWHDAGRRANKQNCFSDFQQAIRYLHREKYSTPARTAIMGGSNGGLLVAAVANQTPELLRAAVCQVGVLDMYKFHKFTIGHAWKSDYGDPDVAEDFAVLETYSPIHNVREGVKYPAILVCTGDHDDRVVPLHSHKYVATLQSTNPELGGPFLERVEVSAGHGAGMPTSKRIRETADTYTFLAMTLEAPWVE